MIKIPDLKIETVPVEKEIKVLVPYKVPYEIKVPYIVHQKVHTHVEHKPPKKHHHSYHHESDFHQFSQPDHHLFDDDSRYFHSPKGFAASSEIAPMYISHHPVEYPQSLLQSSSPSQPHSTASNFYDESGQIPQQHGKIAKFLRADLNDFSSTLHTSAFSPEQIGYGFGSQEGLKPTQENYDEGDNDEFEGEEREYEEVGPVVFRNEKRKTKKVPATTTTTTSKPPPKKRHHHNHHDKSKKRKEKSFIHSAHPVSVGNPYNLRSTFVRADEYYDDE